MPVRTCPMSSGERRRVAQELHESLARRAPGELLGDVRATQDATREAIDRISLVARRLRPEALSELGLARALAALAGRVADESGLRVKHRVAPDGILGMRERALLIGATLSIADLDAGSVEVTLTVPLER